MPPRPMPVVAPRECGACSACCYAIPVRDAALRKAGHRLCPHQGERGCGIYEARPESCREFRCMWLGGWGRLSDRPDRLGLVVEPVRPELPELAVVSEVWPGARNGRRAQYLVAALLAQVPTVAILRPDRDPVVLGAPLELDVGFVEELEAKASSEGVGAWPR